ncbi:5'/3'-nucleotidase SurE [Chlamydiales bacterium]|nr:5'/3'-nucleotidase SurE [Chlamydiales bacterium]
MKPKILITNDDGVNEPGIRFLWEALHEIADVTVVAPSTEKSATALSITVRHPLKVESVHWEGANAWSVTGTPADCIKLGLSEYMTTPPDLILSGINPGSNAGRNLLYSGTVGGVIEGILHQIPGIAFSTASFTKPNFSDCIPYIKNIVQDVLDNPLPVGTLLNVNFPDTPTFQGLKFTRQGSGMWVEDPDKRIHPTQGHSYFWIGQKEFHPEEPEDTDTWWLNKGFITAAPIHIAELTDHRLLKTRKKSFEKLFNEKLTAYS